MAARSAPERTSSRRASGQRARPRRIVSSGSGSLEEARSVYVEMELAWRTVLAGLGVVVALAVLAGLAAAGHLSPTPVPGSPSDPVWQSSLVVLALLASSAQLVSLTLMMEHRVDAVAGGAHRLGLGLLWVLRLATVAGLVAAMSTAVREWRPEWGRLDRWHVTSWEDALRLCTALAIGGLFLVAASRGARGAPPAAQATPAAPAAPPSAPPSPDPAPSVVVRWVAALVHRLHAVVAAAARLVRRGAAAPASGHPSPAPGATGDVPVPDLPCEPDRLVAIGASGGGIRAASFVMGGHQAVQDAAPSMGMTRPQDEPHVFAVSGGSYVAAALAMRRAFDGGTGATRLDPVDWRTAYAGDSAELDRLRRHTRYLFEPRSQTLDGLVTLLVGAVINLFVCGVALLALVWVGSQLTMTFGLVSFTDDTVTDGSVLDYHMDLGSWAWLAVPIGCLVVLVLLTFAGWAGAALFDKRAASSGLLGNEARRRAERLLRSSTTGRSAAAGLAIGWVVLVAGLPAAASGVAEAATHNQPTATVARGLAALGLVSREMCADAFEKSVVSTAETVQVAARANPGAERSGTAVACGAELSITRTVEPEDVSAPPPQVVLTGAEIDALEQYADLGDGSIGGRVAGIGGLLLAVLGLLRRGPAPGEAAEGKSRMTGLRRHLMTWVPLGVTALIAVYLALLWSRWLVLAEDGSAVTLVAALCVAACLVAFLLDANVTTMHRFYRSRLADAFAVGVDEAGCAEQLPDDRVYRFSDLPGARGQAVLTDARRTAAAAAGQPGRTVAAAAAAQASAAASADLLGRLHIVTTLNTQARNESPTMRGGFPVVFGSTSIRLFRECGSQVERDMDSYEAFAGPGRVSVMAAVAMSGAAVSPLMGRYAQQMAPYRFLLAVFNVRLGTWVRNPAHAPAHAAIVAGGDLASEQRGRGARFLKMTSKPGLAQMVLEAAGSSSATRRWVYLSDGGHLDNTGLVEAVRHCVLANGTVGRVLVLDASNDADNSWSAVGDAIAVVRADLNIDLRRQHDSTMAPWMRLFEAGGLSVLVVKAVPVRKPAAGEADDGWWSRLPPDVQSFQVLHPDFPRASTGRQKFGDLEFEAYRAYAYMATTAALDAVGWTTADTTTT